FVSLVDEGRPNLAEREVRLLADGSIFTAPEAMENGLIDEIGYFDAAVAKAEDMAHIDNARVVEYKQIFSFWSMMGAQSKQGTITIESELLDKLAAPRLLYLWDGKE
ncbi:MAG: S49 family peptidase, partial [Planctomycetes bacterium]|nr:S49 family peptidase [Planctomycetota bacterium]